MRLVLADDEMKVRSALHLLLEQETDFQVVGEAADAAGLLGVTAERAPDMVLLDWELPGLPPEQLLRLLRFERPSLIVIAMSSRPQRRQAALDAGAQAFVSKGESPQHMLSILCSDVWKDSHLQEHKEK